jgi:hypothetical protein
MPRGTPYTIATGTGFEIIIIANGPAHFIYSRITGICLCIIAIIVIATYHTRCSCGEDSVGNRITRPIRKCLQFIAISRSQFHVTYIGTTIYCGRIYGTPYRVGRRTRICAKINRAFLMRRQCTIIFKIWFYVPGLRFRTIFLRCGLLPLTILEYRELRSLCQNMPRLWLGILLESPFLKSPLRESFEGYFSIFSQRKMLFYCQNLCHWQARDQWRFPRLFLHIPRQKHSPYQLIERTLELNPCGYWKSSLRRFYSQQSLRLLHFLPYRPIRKYMPQPHPLGSGVRLSSYHISRVCTTWKVK